jgi:hypothetical protein
MTAYYPAIQNTLNAWNSFTSFTSASVGAASISANWLSLPQQVTFQDSGHLQVTVSPSGDTFDVVENSVFDCSGNQVPDQRGDFVGHFIFENLAAQNEFRNFGALYNIEFAVSQMCLPERRTTCTKTAEGKYTCTLISSSCSNK